MGRILGRQERAIHLGEVDRSLLREMREEGVFWPGEFVCPVIVPRLDPDDPEGGWIGPPAFAGSATLLGGDLFVTAAHVARSLFPEQIGDVRPMLAIVDLNGAVGRTVYTGIEWLECHPDTDVDLAIGKLIEWNARCHWAGWAQVSPLQDVSAVGYPLDLMAPIQQGELEVLNNPRYLKGYVTRSLDTISDEFALQASFEVSFPLPEGMSGSPVWAYEREDNQRVLVGVVTGTRSDRRQVAREETAADDGTRTVLIQERVDEYGVALRLSAVLDWPIRQLEGRLLGELVPNDSTGELPARLKEDSDYWQSIDNYELPARQGRSAWSFLWGRSRNRQAVSRRSAPSERARDSSLPE